MTAATFYRLERVAWIVFPAIAILFWALGDIAAAHERRAEVR